MRYGHHNIITQCKDYDRDPSLLIDGLSCLIISEHQKQLETRHCGCYKHNTSKHSMPIGIDQARLEDIVTDHTANIAQNAHHGESKGIETKSSPLSLTCVPVVKLFAIVSVLDLIGIIIVNPLAMCGIVNIPATKLRLLDDV